MDKTALGDRMKWYESQETDEQFLPMIPVVVRVDGRSFSRFTKPFERPIDEKFRSVMVEVTKYLVDQTNAVIGYTQSDEISLVLYTENPKSQMFFNGRKFKLTSGIAAMASVKFLALAQQAWPEYIAKMDQSDSLPTFDCRCFQVPTKDEAVNALIWREQDATKNAITMAAYCYYSHKELEGKNGKAKKAMLADKGVDFNDYPVYFRRGTYVKRRLVTQKLEEEIIQKIPEQHRPKDGLVQRHQMQEMRIPPLAHIENRVGVIFYDDAPETESKVV